MISAKSMAALVKKEEMISLESALKCSSGILIIDPDSELYSIVEKNKQTLMASGYGLLFNRVVTLDSKTYKTIEVKREIQISFTGWSQND